MSSSCPPHDWQYAGVEVATDYSEATVLEYCGSGSCDAVKRHKLEKPGADEPSPTKKLRRKYADDPEAVDELIHNIGNGLDLALSLQQADLLWDYILTLEHELYGRLRGM